MGKDTLEGPRLWQNSTAVKRSIQLLQQSSELQTGSVAQEAAKTCCLDSLSSDRGLCTKKRPEFGPPLAPGL
ncbi:TPA: hypothetical protein ACH3X1_011431 [Trebouxia sp. C0004]